MMKTILILCLLLSFGCSSLHHAKDIKVIEMYSKGEFFAGNENLPSKNSIVKFERTVRIVYKDDAKLYIVPKVKMYTKDILNEAGKVVDNVLVKQDTVILVYCVQNGNKKGLLYTLKNFRGETPTTFNADKMMQELTITNEDLKTFDYQLGTPKQIIKNGSEIVHKFSIEKTTFADADSIYRFYNSDLNNVEFSFSKDLDKKNRAKLYKTVFVFSKIPAEKSMVNIEIPRRETLYEIRCIDHFDVGLYNEIFNKFSTDIKK
jgi:hypothetical protein